MTKRFWAMFDADDTLLGVEINGKPMGTAQAYNDVLSRFAARMEEIGFDPKIAFERQLAIDSAAAAIVGFSDKSRFPTSIRKAYEELASELGGTFDPAISKQMEKLGWTVFTDYPYVPLPGALNTLKEASRDYHVAIVTKGEDSEQRKKVFDSGCFVYADQVITMAHKNLDEWDEKIVKGLKLAPNIRKFSWAIGNSAKSDVNPPLLLGFNGLLLSGEATWAFEHGAVAPAMKDRQFAEIPTIEDSLRYLYPQTIGSKT